MSSVTFAGLSLEKPRIFGIINVTPDSFSDGGDALALEDALRRGKAMLDAGADILDVGGESTRPGAAPVGIEDEIARAVPVVRGLSDLGAKVSIDPRHAPVMEAAIEAGAQDFEQGEDGEVVFLTEATDLDAVAKALPEFGYKVLTAKLVYRANNPVALGDAERAEVEAFLDAIDADDDVQNVYVGLAG